MISVLKYYINEPVYTINNPNLQFGNNINLVYKKMREWLSKKINYFKNRKVNLDSQKDTSENLILLKTLIENFNNE